MSPNKNNHHHHHHRPHLEQYEERKQERERERESEREREICIYIYIMIYLYIYIYVVYIHSRIINNSPFATSPGPSELEPYLVPLAGRRVLAQPGPHVVAAGRSHKQRHPSKAGARQGRLGGKGQPSLLMQFPKMSMFHPHPRRSSTPTDSYFEDGLKPEPTRSPSEESTCNESWNPQLWKMVRMPIRITFH